MTLTSAACAVLAWKHNPLNRKISCEKVDGYGRAMKAGDWGYTHQGVAFTSNGDIADGQHRLIAAGLYGWPLKTLVTSDMDREVIPLIDRATRRTAAQALAMDSIKDAEAKVPVARGFEEHIYRLTNNVRLVLSDLELNRRIIANEMLLESALMIARRVTGGITKPMVSVKEAAIYAALMLHFGNPVELIENVLNDVLKGEVSYPDAPTGLLINKLEAARLGKKADAKLTSGERINLMIKASNAFARRVGLKKLEWDERGEGYIAPSRPVAKAAE
jgi:hypothetical protein